jgi:hypothetical protein
MVRDWGALVNPICRPQVQRAPAAISSANGAITSHHVALPAEKVRGPVSREVIFCAAGVLSATPLTFSLRRDDSGFVVFCFAKPEDAQVFAKRFGGERVRRAAGGDPENTRATERVFQDERQAQKVSSLGGPDQ